MDDLLKTFRFSGLLNRAEYYALPQKLRLSDSARSLEHVVFVVEENWDCSRVQSIRKHLLNLAEYPLRITVVSNDGRPEWLPAEFTYVRAPLTMDIINKVPLCDLIVMTHFQSLQSCIDLGLAPVLFFELGGEWLTRFHEFRTEVQQFIRIQLSLPQFIATTSPYYADKILQLFGREASLVDNGWDEEVLRENSNTGALPTGPFVLTDAVNNERILAAFEEARTEIPNLTLVQIDCHNGTEERTGSVWKIPSEDPSLERVIRNAAAYFSFESFPDVSRNKLIAMNAGCLIVSDRDEFQLNRRMPYSIQCDHRTIVDDFTAYMTIQLQDPVYVKPLLDKAKQLSAEFKWDHQTGKFWELCREVAAYEVVPLQSLDEWHINVTDEMFYSEEDRIRFERLLRNTYVELVQLPVIYDLLQGHRVAKWEAVAHKKKKSVTVENVFTHLTTAVFMPIKGGQEVHLPYLTPYTYYSLQQFNEAFKLFYEMFQQELNPNRQIVLLRWAVLCLIELGKEQEAIEILNTTFDKVNDNVDLHYLYILCQCYSGGNLEDIQTSLEYIKYLEVALGYDEFFLDIEQLLDEKLGIVFE